MGLGRMTKITHCIFDLDGLLLNTEPCYSLATSRLLEKYGTTLTDDLKLSLLGLNSSDSAEMIIKSLNLNINKETLILERSGLIRNIFQESNVELMPGVLNLVTHLKNHNIDIAIATSSSKDLFELKIRNYIEFFNLFGDNITFGDDHDVKFGKPKPDIFISAWKKFNSPSLENCLVFEDAVSGVNAAIAAKMKVIWVSNSNEDTEFSKNVQKLTSLEYFKPENYKLPAF